MKAADEFLTKKKPLVSYRLVENTKTKGKKADVTTSKPKAIATSITQAYFAVLKQEVKDIKD